MIYMYILTDLTLLPNTQLTVFKVVEVASLSGQVESEAVLLQFNVVVLGSDNTQPFHLDWEYETSSFHVIKRLQNRHWTHRTL